MQTGFDLGKTPDISVATSANPAAPPVCAECFHEAAHQMALTPGQYLFQELRLHFFYVECWHTAGDMTRIRMEIAARELLRAFPYWITHATRNNDQIVLKAKRKIEL